MQLWDLTRCRLPSTGNDTIVSVAPSKIFDPPRSK